MIELTVGVLLLIVMFAICDRAWRKIRPRDFAISRLYFMSAIEEKMKQRGWRYDWKSRRIIK